VKPGEDESEDVGQINRIAAHNTADLGFCGLESGVLKVYDLKSGVCAKTLNAHQDGVNAIEMDYVSSGYRFFTGGNDGCIKVWDARKYECISEVLVTIICDNMIIGT